MAVGVTEGMAGLLVGLEVKVGGSKDISGVVLGDGVGDNVSVDIVTGALLTGVVLTDTSTADVEFVGGVSPLVGIDDASEAIEVLVVDGATSDAGMLMPVEGVAVEAVTDTSPEALVEISDVAEVTSVPEGTPEDGKTPEVVVGVSVVTESELSGVPVGTTEEMSDAILDEMLSIGREAVAVETMSLVGVSLGTKSVAVVVGTTVPSVGTTLPVPEGTLLSVGIIPLGVSVGTIPLDVSVGTTPVGVSVGRMTLGVSVGRMSLGVAVGTISLITEPTSETTLEITLPSSEVMSETRLLISEITDGTTGTGVTPGSLAVGAVGAAAGSVTPAPEVGSMPEADGEMADRSDSTDDKIGATSGPDVVSEAGIEPESVGVGTDESAVPKAVVIPTSIPVEGRL